MEPGWGIRVSGKWVVLIRTDESARLSWLHFLDYARAGFFATLTPHKLSPTRSAMVQAVFSTLTMSKRRR